MDESKLKTLKVVDLRAILSKANVSCPTKANKQDIINRIIASQVAIQIYHQLYPDKNVDNPPTPIEQVTPKIIQSKSAPSTQPISAPLNTPKDLEAEKRSQRAARFGIAVVEPPKPLPASVAHNGTPTTSKPPMAAAGQSLPDDPEKLKARAARFGIQRVVERSEDVDAEEAERRRKRAKRFGLT